MSEQNETHLWYGPLIHMFFLKKAINANQWDIVSLKVCKEQYAS